MKVKTLEISHFRGIERLRLLMDDNLNVLVGINGSGKTSVLDCMAILLSRFIGSLRASAGTGRFFTESDISNRANETRNDIEVEFRNRPLGWSVVKTRRGKQRQLTTRLQPLRSSITEFRAVVTAEEHTPLPLTVYYPVNRAVLDIPLRIRKQHPFDRMAAYDQALSSGSNFRIFFEWFRLREDLENERRLDRPKFRDPQLRAVRKAIGSILPGFKRLRVRRSPLRMVVSKDREELIVNQLSDGEKCTLAMIGDLARRMAIANPHMANPLDTEAVALIDEIELHLHPAWQRRITDAMRETFPNTQFILSTHSPQVLSHLAPECVWLLERSRRGITATHPESAYGQSSNRILEDIMDVAARPETVEKRLKELFLAIEDGNLDDASNQCQALREGLGADPDLVRAESLIHRKRVLHR